MPYHCLGLQKFSNFTVNFGGSPSDFAQSKALILRSQLRLSFWANPDYNENTGVPYPVKYAVFIVRPTSLMPTNQPTPDDLGTLSSPLHYTLSYGAEFVDLNPLYFRVEYKKFFTMGPQFMDQNPGVAATTLVPIFSGFPMRKDLNIRLRHRGFVENPSSSTLGTSETWDEMVWFNAPTKNRYLLIFSDDSRDPPDTNWLAAQQRMWMQGA